MKFLFQHTPIWQDKGLAVVRLIFAALLIYHGKEVFQPELLQEYAKWDAFKDMNGVIMVYLGKGAELVAGVLLFLGLLTRIGALICIGTFLYITFFIGGGKFWYQDQHPFMFALFGLLFFFMGAGAWNLDSLVLKKK
jgi:putative oxidoreductase